MKEIHGLLKKLKDYDELKGIKAARANSEKEKILNQLIKKLRQTDINGQKTFLYSSDIALMDS